MLLALESMRDLYQTVKTHLAIVVTITHSQYLCISHTQYDTVWSLTQCTLQASLPLSSSLET